MKRRGLLTAADIEIWHAVAATVPHKMPGARLPAPPDMQKPEIPKHGALGPAVPRPPTVPGWSPLPQRSSHHPAGVDKTLRRRVTAGRQPIDAALDLHGFRQAEAHARLIAFVTRAQRDGHRLVLVVTGKGTGLRTASVDAERGVLRRLVPLWLEEANLRPLVVGFGEAGRGHGGAGALYIHLRRRDRGARD